MKCTYCDRDDTVCRIKKIGGKYYCPTHLTRHYRGQDMYGKTIYDPNDYIFCDDHAEIVLRNTHGKEVARAIIDLDDVNKCRQYKWHIRHSKGNTDYVIASLHDNQKVHLHRLITNYNGPDDVDHINMNGLDNRKANLRVVPHNVNKANNKSVGVKRVKSGKFQACCCRNYKTIYIGTYDTYDEAVKARADFVSKL